MKPNSSLANDTNFVSNPATLFLGRHTVFALADQIYFGGYRADHLEHANQATTAIVSL